MLGCCSQGLTANLETRKHLAVRVVNGVSMHRKLFPVLVQSHILKTLHKQLLNAGDDLTCF